MALAWLLLIPFIGLLWVPFYNQPGPALVYTVNACGFFALPYTIVVYPIVFFVMSRLWIVAVRAGHVTAADVVHARYGSRPLELAVAITGVLATMPYIALQLIGMEVVIKALGLNGEIPLIIAFLILAFYTYSAGLRAPTPSARTPCCCPPTHFC